MPKVHFNTAFQGLSEDDINTWIVFNRKKLIGSAIFTPPEYTMVDTLRRH